MGTDPGYDRLTALDESFLHLERPETPMHVGAVAVLEREPFYDADGRFRLDAVRTLVASRLQLIPRFRKRVMRVPLGGGRPVWVDHDTFDIADHVRLTSLPAPGGRRQLLELAERLMTQVLDRDRPLWELWFVDGVDGGAHVGLIHKSHHTLTDGISGVDIATVLLDFTVEPTVLDHDGWTPAPASFAITSLAFMFDEVPEPVWKTSIGNCLSWAPDATSAAAAEIAFAVFASSRPRSPLTTAAAPLMRPSQWMTSAGTGSPEILKFATAFAVSPP